MDLDDALATLELTAQRHKGLRLLLLHGSRSRQQEHSRSDWDLGYVADDGVDPAGLHADVSHALGTDAVDLADLARASALFRFEVARHGRCIYERAPGIHQAFVMEATIFWCDAEPVIRRAQAAVLASVTA
jgi:predicted nucleotidyltransferase